MRRLRYRKVPFSGVHTNTLRYRRQKKKHSRERFESCVFGHHFHRRHVDDSRSRNKKVAFYAFVWTGSKVVSSFSQYLATNFLSW